MTWYWMMAGVALVAFVLLYRLPSRMRESPTVQPVAAVGAGDLVPALERVLGAYFSQRGIVGTQLDVHLLRSEPTRSGAAYPKYYEWVALYAGDRVMEEGVARIAALEGARFAVTHFISRNDIAGNPARLASLFPAELIPRILNRAGGLSR